jgi:membrane-associated phospholipid phosphatase
LLGFGLLLPLILLLLLTFTLTHDYVYAVDLHLALTLHPYANAFYDHTAMSLAYLGGFPGSTVIGMTLCAAVYTSHAAPHERRRWLFFLSVTLVGGAALGWALKWGIERPRPLYWPRPMAVYGASFPSGHSLYAAILAYVMIILCWCTRWRWPVLVLGLLWAGLMGLSRVYIGAHFPTDVFGGWLLACCWVTAVYLGLTRWIKP